MIYSKTVILTKNNLTWRVFVSFDLTVTSHPDPVVYL